MEKTNDTWTVRNKRNIWRLMFWTFGWTGTLAIATFGSLLVWPSKPFITILSILVNLAFGIGMILANKHYLQGLDELQRKIQLEAMAISLGIGVVFGISFSVMDQTDIIPFDAEFSFLVILMALSYMAAIWVGKNKYE